MQKLQVPGKLVIVVILICIAGFASAQTKIAPIFTSHMVLQQNENVVIWGTDSANVKITITTSWTKPITTQANGNGSWRATLATPGAGVGHRINVEGTQKIVLDDVLIGEVWLCSGQSNMEMPLAGFDGSDTIQSRRYSTLANETIRMFDVEKRASLKTMDDAHGRWLKPDAANIGKFSATAFHFAVQLNRKLRVPVGLIVACWSGSTIDAWMGAESLASFDNISIPDSSNQRLTNYTPTVLYNAMIYPLKNYALKGVIWYQGESDVKRYAEYRRLFPALIRGWRMDRDQSDMPFYFVQIAPFDYGDINAAYLREAQLQTMQTSQHVGMVVTMDIGECDNIHPNNKSLVGERLARWALAKSYQIPSVIFLSPIYKYFKKLKNDRIKIMFTNTGGFQPVNPLRGFTIAGPDQKFYPAEGLINSDGTITVWSKDVKKPQAVRYLFTNCGEATLFNIGGLPASPFRTDSWSD